MLSWWIGGRLGREKVRLGEGLCRFMWCDGVGQGRFGLVGVLVFPGKGSDD